jgi:predicted adenylyl cyclase CyaB
VAQNIELKARLDNPSGIRQWLTLHASSGPWPQTQRDTYFRCGTGRLKMREWKDSAELIWYDRADETAIRASNYLIVAIADPAPLGQLLSCALGIEVVVEKFRELWWYENVRVHLDQVSGLGAFIEFEGVVDQHHSAGRAAASVQWLVEQLGVHRDTWLNCSYRELLLDHRG